LSCVELLVIFQNVDRKKCILDTDRRRKSNKALENIHQFEVWCW